MEKERLKIKLDTILGTIFMIVCLIVLGIYSYLENDFKKFNVIVALTIIVLLILLCVELSSIKYRKNEKDHIYNSRIIGISAYVRRG